MKTLLRPTSQLIDNYMNRFNNDERYYCADQAIIQLFRAFPKNEKLEDILLKISVINDLYSTNILGTFKMAKHIQNRSIDHGLLKSDPEVVNLIATGHGIKTKRNKKEINFYSFSTKYCNWHNVDNYPIYDTFVEKVLIAYNQKDNFSNFSHADLKVYRKFKNIINDFVDHYKLKRHNLKEIDKFLWIYGKENFSAKSINSE